MTPDTAAKVQRFGGGTDGTSQPETTKQERHITMKYIVKVPPTADVGSYQTTTSTGGLESYRAKALWDYNSCRAHDGLAPVKRMPAGTSYTLQYEYAVQGNYGAHGWEDLTVEETRKEALAQVKTYRENEGGMYRILRRAA